MTDDSNLQFVMTEISKMKDSLSDKMEEGQKENRDKFDEVNQNISTVREKVAELKGSTDARLDAHDKIIADLQEGHVRLSDKVGENVKTLAVHEQRMNEAEKPDKKAFLDKLLENKIKLMSGGGIGLGVLLVGFGVLWLIDPTLAMAVLDFLLELVF